MRITTNRHVDLLTGLGLALALVATARAVDSPVGNASRCQRIVHVDVVALNSPIMANRFGSGDPDAMLFALKRDVVSNAPGGGTGLTPGNVMLRAGKRPRPIVLRANVGDCLRSDSHQPPDAPTAGPAGYDAARPAGWDRHPRRQSERRGAGTGGRSR